MNWYTDAKLWGASQSDPTLYKTTHCRYCKTHTPHHGAITADSWHVMPTPKWQCSLCNRLSFTDPQFQAIFPMLWNKMIAGNDWSMKEALIALTRDSGGVAD